MLVSSEIASPELLSKCSSSEEHGDEAEQLVEWIACCSWFAPEG